MCRSATPALRPHAIVSGLTTELGVLARLHYRLLLADFSPVKASTDVWSRTNACKCLDLPHCHAAAHSGMNSQTHTSKHSHCYKDPAHTSLGKEIAQNISYRYFSSSSVSIFFSFWLKVSVRTYFGTANRARESAPAPPPADPRVNQTAHGALLAEWQVMQMHI